MSFDPTYAQEVLREEQEELRGGGEDGGGEGGAAPEPDVPGDPLLAGHQGGGHGAEDHQVCI